MSILPFRILPAEFYKTYPLGYLTQLSQVGDLILLSTIAFHSIYLLSNYYFRLNQHYAKLKHSKQASWSIHFVSLLFSTAIVLASIPMAYDPVLLADKLFGSSFYALVVLSITSGYFLWDTLISIYHFKETGGPFVFHGVCCFTVFTLSFLPFVQGYGSVFLIFEASTIFLNIHWFCDKTGRTGTNFQWLNGLVLIIVFFICRIIMGTIGMGRYVLEAYNRQSEIPNGLWQFYGFAAVGLGSLNFYWFKMMIRSITSRFKTNKVE